MKGVPQSPLCFDCYRNRATVNHSPDGHRELPPILAKSLPSGASDFGIRTSTR